MAGGGAAALIGYPGCDSMMLSSPERRATLIAFGNAEVTDDNLGSGTAPDPGLFGIASKLRKVIAGAGRAR